MKEFWERAGKRVKAGPAPWQLEEFWDEPISKDLVQHAVTELLDAGTKALDMLKKAAKAENQQKVKKCRVWPQWKNMLKKKRRRAENRGAMGA